MYLERVGGATALRVYGGGDLIELTVNSSTYECAPGQTATRTQNSTTCTGAFSNTAFFGAEAAPGGLSAGAIAGITLAVLALAGGAAGLGVYLAKRHPARCDAQCCQGAPRQRGSLSSLRLR